MSKDDIENLRKDFFRHIDSYALYTKSMTEFKESMISFKATVETILKRKDTVIVMSGLTFCLTCVVAMVTMINYIFKVA